MLRQGLGRIIEQFSKDRGVERKVVIDALETAFLMAAKKKYGLNREIEAHFNEEVDNIELFEFKKVVEKIENEATDIVLSEARKLDPGVEAGDSIGIKMSDSQFGRIDVATIKQVLNQKVMAAERDIVYREYSGRKGEIISGIVRRFEGGNILVDLGKTEAVIPPREQIPGENFRAGDRVQAYILDVQEALSKGPQLILSRSTSLYLIKLFDLEVPEVSERIVVIKGAARDPGFRSKIAVYSKDSDVDAVGACVGVKGTRVQNVVQELRGEKIDIVPWSDNDTQFVVNALAPAEISKVIIDDANHSMEVIVPDDQLSLAIGKKGQNVRLAMQLTGWKLDIITESKILERTNRAKISLKTIPRVNDTLAMGLYQHGYDTFEDVAVAEIKDLLHVPGMDDEEKAKNLKEEAQSLVAKGLTTDKVIHPERSPDKAQDKAQDKAPVSITEEGTTAEKDKKAPE
ncbi:MAG: transcription termination factor NusA [Deltaproteobacteria bacterium]